MFFEKLAEAGLDPADFLITTDVRWPGISHRTNDFFVKLRTSAWNTKKYKLRVLVERGRENYYSDLDWAGVGEIVSNWCELLKAPNLWADLQHAHEVLTAAHDGESDNTPFTAEERADISRQLTEIKTYVKETLSLTADQISRVQERIDEADKASKRMKRKDWLLLFSGTILTVIVTDFVSPEIAHHMLIMALHGLGHLFGTVPNQTRELP